MNQIFIVPVSWDSKFRFVLCVSMVLGVFKHTLVAVQFPQKKKKKHETFSVMVSFTVV